MALSKYKTYLHTSEGFVESAGAVLFKLSTREICLVRHRELDEYLLPKGRRNVGESRQQTAMRETREETGYQTRLLPVTLRTRCTPNAEDIGSTPDEARRYENIVEPYMVTHRIISKANIKLIWWYVGAIDEDAAKQDGEEQFSAELLSFREALLALEYQQDREIVAKAIDIFEETFGSIEKGK